LLLLLRLRLRLLLHHRLWWWWLVLRTVAAWLSGARSLETRPTISSVQPQW
jgi:hypothetical protein